MTHRWKPKRVEESERGIIKKRCSTCSKEYTLLDFNKGNALHGYKSECKACQQLRNSAYKKIPENRERENAAQRKRHAKLSQEEKTFIYLSRKEYFTEYQRWWLKNTERGRVQAKKRDLRKKLRRTSIDVSSVVSLEEYNKNKFKNDGFTCEYCHKQIKGPYHLEHIIPVFKKGSGKLENLAIACPSCNCRKGVKDLSEFAPNKTSYFKNRKL